jgi:hypothetical protein
MGSFKVSSDLPKGLPFNVGCETGTISSFGFAVGLLAALSLGLFQADVELAMKPVNCGI